MANSMGLVVSLAEMEQFYRGDKAGQIIELMNKTNDIMDDVLWMESNQSDGHLTRIRTGLPEVYWRRLYQGTPPSKSQWSQVKEGCGILEALMELDVEEINLYGDKARAFRLSEGKAFAEAMPGMDEPYKGWSAVLMEQLAAIQREPALYLMVQLPRRMERQPEPPKPATLC